MINNAFERGENELIINQESDKAFHGRMPRVRKWVFTVLGSENGGVAKAQGDEPHLFGDSGGFSGVEFTIDVSPYTRRWVRRCGVVSGVVVVVENDGSSGVEGCSFGEWC